MIERFHYKEDARFSKWLLGMKNYFLFAFLKVRPCFFMAKANAQPVFLTLALRQGLEKTSTKRASALNYFSLLIVYSTNPIKAFFESLSGKDFNISNASSL